jgi:hypothetical protein
MRYAHILCGWSKRLKPNESRRAFIRSAWLCFVASTSRSHAPRALLDEAIDRSASGSEIPVAVIGGFPPIFVLNLGQSAAKSMLLRDGSRCMLTSARVTRERRCVGCPIACFTPWITVKNGLFDLAQLRCLQRQYFNVAARRTKPYVGVGRSRVAA